MLISLDRAKQQIPNLSGCDDGTLANLVAACSVAVETYCRRRFKFGTYDELYDGTGTSYLFLSNPPIRRVLSVRTNQLPACYFQYPDPTNLVQAATVDVTSTGVVLTVTQNAVTTQTTLLFTTYPTFDALATYVNTLSPWQATLNPQFAKWATADLIPSQGSYSARNISTYLPVYWYYLPQFNVSEARGEIYCPYGFSLGYQNYRISAECGFDPIPQDLQLAVATLVQQAFTFRGKDPNTASETLNKYSYARIATAALDNLGVSAKLILNSYKLHRIPRYK